MAMWCLCYREATTAQITNTRKTKGFDIFLSLQQSWWSVPLWSVGNQKLPLIQYVYHLIKSSCCNCLVRTDAVVGDEFLAFTGKPHIHEGWHWITGRCCVGRHLENSQHLSHFYFGRLWQRGYPNYHRVALARVFLWVLCCCSLLTSEADELIVPFVTA